MQYFHSGSSNLEQTIPLPISHQTWIYSLHELAGALCRWVLSCWCEQTAKEKRKVSFLWAAACHGPHNPLPATAPARAHHEMVKKKLFPPSAPKKKINLRFESWAVSNTYEIQVTAAMPKPVPSARLNPSWTCCGKARATTWGSSAAFVMQLLQEPGKASVCQPPEVCLPFSKVTKIKTC